MNKSMFILGIFLLIALPLVYADVPSVPDPTHKTISVVNNITNLNDFPDYVFVSVSNGPAGGSSMCEVIPIGQDQIIEIAAYRWCGSADVYAIKKSDYNQNLTGSQIINSSMAIKVLSGITNSEFLPVTDTRSTIYNEYKINLSNSTDIPHKQVVETDYSFYLYLIIPIFAIIVVIVILVKRRQ